MKAFISLDKLFLLFFMCFSGIAYGQQFEEELCSHLVIEDLGDPQCNWVDERTTFSFCVSISRYPSIIPVEQPPIYVGYSVGGVEYTPVKIDWSDFIANTCVRTACITSDEIIIPSQDCNKEIVVKLLKKVGDDFEIYPIYSYRSSGQIFSCNFFLDIECDPEPNLCGGSIESPGLGSTSGFDLCPAILSADIDLCCGQAINGGGNNSENRQSNNQDNSIFSMDLSTNFQIQASPNPFVNELDVNYQLANSDLVKVQLIDLSGRVVYEIEEKTEAGFHQKTIRTDELSKGVFYLQLQTSSEKKFIKLIKF